ncbi:MAG: hypothetical protein US40_C0004G0093 [Candidatus Roizmanbacteria bacterium GW2011_GWC2_37_13]|uniref:Right handed beta helix domain-containing protein n=1 Tax=Candidatus Roizmanbacteria bacterium GW2011_GWC2_37_13 TaxID=1618486 RepID=A0A0G0G4K7_9BACT|nr:MAG: hypothetical protein US38_C0001G0079 [Candidatus Roizmanbacteria bacterium GW2011_GWC1_37_12]KKQ26058.1 MAG: hypothetical protein US40_C0004G0093 [Candidatus Roizmanbacteria bacterium GW2011_GWC2_37_13]
MPSPLTFDFYNSIIEVPSPDTSVDLQYLINQIRDTEDELNPAMSYSKIADAFGKQSLGGGTFVGLTVQLLNNWKLRFQARNGPDTIACIVTGGNLVAESGNPISPSAYTQITIAQSSSPTIATPDDNTNIKYLIESLRGSEASGIGNIFYWDPVNGNDSNTGTLPSKAVATFAQAQILTTDSNFDVIYCLSSHPSGITTVTETLSITKNTLKVRGPGHTFQLKPTATSNDTISVGAHSVEISGIYIETAVTGSANAISVTGNRNLIKDCWITNVRGQGINMISSAFSKITGCVIENCDGNGIKTNNSVIQLNISKNIISNNADGILLSGTGTSDNLVENNLIYKNSAYGVAIGSGVVNTNVRGANTIVNNTTGNTQDLGTDTYIETQAGGASASEIADAVWDEVISGHTTAGSMGKTLKDAKAKATLASLK